MGSGTAEAGQGTTEYPLTPGCVAIAAGKMKQSRQDRKHLVSHCLELVLINRKAATPNPIG